MRYSHEEPRWNPATSEWFCVRCGRTCDHLTKQDAQVELEQFECSLPSVNAVLHTGKRRALHSSCPSARVRSTESPIALNKSPTSRIWRPRHRSSLCSRSMLLKLPRFPTANTCYTPKADRFTLTTTRGNGLRPGGLHRICISFKLLIADLPVLLRRLLQPATAQRVGRREPSRHAAS